MKKIIVPPDLPPRIFLCWDDACYNVDDVAHKDLGSTVRLYEFGFLIKETKETYVICSEYMPGETSSRLTLTVPKKNVVWKKIYTTPTV